MPKLFSGRAGPGPNIYGLSGFGPDWAGPARIDTPKPLDIQTKRLIFSIMVSNQVLPLFVLRFIFPTFSIILILYIYRSRKSIPTSHIFLDPTLAICVVWHPLSFYGSETITVSKLSQKSSKEERNKHYGGGEGLDLLARNIYSFCFEARVRIRVGAFQKERSASEERTQCSSS